MRGDVIVFGMTHQSHVHIIEMTPADKLGLAGQELDVVLLSKVHTVAYLD